MGKNLNVIVPCYNEEKSLTECIAGIQEVLGDVQITVVNDGSDDHTQSVAEDLSRNSSFIRVINFNKNRGKSEAVKEALDLSSAEIIMLHDADLTVSAECLKVFYERITDKPNSFFMGSRFLLKMERKAMPLKNFIANKITAWLFSIILRQRITDALCGTKAFPAKLKVFLGFSECRWPDFDLLLAARRGGLHIEEIAVRYFPRRFGKSSLRLYPDVWQLVKRMIEIARGR